jgi:hypothetical protein
MLKARLYGNDLALAFVYRTQNQRRRDRRGGSEASEALRSRRATSTSSAVNTMPSALSLLRTRAVSSQVVAPKTVSGRVPGPLTPLLK